MGICSWGRPTAAITLALVILVPLGRAWAEPVGFVAALEGDVEVLPTGETSWTAAVIDRDVEVGDTLRTGPGAVAKVLLVDETILTLGEETELLIDSYIVGPNATKDPSVLRLLKGKARVLVGEAFGGPTRVEMHTPTAVIGVKGTEFDAQVIEDSQLGLWTLCCNLDGSVFVRQIDPSQGGRVEPRPGFCTQVFPDLPPEREIPRPVQFPPVRNLATKAEPGTAESTVLGPSGVAAQGSGETGVGDWVLEPGEGPDLVGSELEGGTEGLGNQFEDVVQTQAAEGNTGSEGSPSSFPSPPGTPQVPSELPGGNAPQAPGP